MASEQTSFVISDSRRDVIAFNPDGTIWVNPDMKPDEAAKAFLVALRQQFRTFIKETVQ